jgi:hypothetical protein
VKIQGVYLRSLSRTAIIPATLAGFVALTAHGRWPYDYYEIFRWIIAGSAVLCVYLMRAKIPAAILCAIVALMFNPIAPLRERAGTWRTLDVLAAVVMFGIAIYAYRADQKPG